jgi:hypothetical protein
MDVKQKISEDQWTRGREDQGNRVLIEIPMDQRTMRPMEYNKAMG